MAQAGQIEMDLFKKVEKSLQMTNYKANIINLLKAVIIGTRRKERRMPDGWKPIIEKSLDSDMSKYIFTKKTTR